MSARPDTSRAEEVPAVNIGETERSIRLVLGVVLLIGGVAGAYGMAAAEVHRAWRLFLFPVFYQGVRFLYDHRTGTCPVKAELGQRKLDGRLTILGDRIGDSDLALRIRRVSRRALARSVVLGALFTAISLLL